MKKALKTALIILAVLIVLGGCIGGYFIWRHNDLYIGKTEALHIALDHAGLTAAQLKEYDVEFEKNKYSAWYEVEFETYGMEYEYSVDAASGEILYSDSQPEHVG